MSSVPNVRPATVDRQGAAEYLGVSMTTLYELTLRREVLSLSIGKRRLYRYADLDAFLAERVTGRSA